MRRRRRPSTAASPSLVLDSGAVSAVAAERERAMAMVNRALTEQRLVVIPAVVLAESTTGRGPRDASVNRVIAAVGEVAPIDEGVARLAGSLRYRARTDATVDAIVVATAARDGRGAVVLTGERRADHLRRLATGLPGVRVEPV